MIYQVKDISGYVWGVCECVRVCAGVHGCGQVWEGVRGYAQVCTTSLAEFLNKFKSPPQKPISGYLGRVIGQNSCYLHICFTFVQNYFVFPKSIS